MIFRLLFMSPTPQRLADFYRHTYGMACVTMGEHHFALSNMSIIKGSSNAVGGIIGYHKDMAGKEQRLGRFMYVEHPTSLDVPPFDPAWVGMLRTKNPQHLLPLYASLGAWVQEQHDQGPIHYAWVREEQVFEIYPTKGEDSLGFVITKGTERYAQKDPEGRGLLFLPT